MKKIELRNNRGFALVDDEDYKELSSRKWFILQRKHTAYATSMIYRAEKRTSVSMHRLIMSAPEGMEVDHIDGDGLNNQRFNLRVCTSSQNSMNQHRVRGLSKYKGVYRDNRYSKWRVCIAKEGKQLFLGACGSEIECAKAYDAKAKELFGEFAHLNFPEAKQLARNA